MGALSKSRHPKECLGRPRFAYRHPSSISGMNPESAGTMSRTLKALVSIQLCLLAWMSGVQLRAQSGLGSKAADGKQVKDTAEARLAKCPMPDLEREINETLKIYALDQKNPETVHCLFRLLSRTIPSYDCRRDYDSAPIPAWWMANDDSIDNWLAFIIGQVKNNDPTALKLFMRFYAISDGFWAETLSFRLLEVLFGQPRFVLQCWMDIREFSEKISDAQRFESLEGTTRLINLYSDIGMKYKKLKSASEELIGLLRKGEGPLGKRQNRQWSASFDNLQMV